MYPEDFVLLFWLVMWIGGAVMNSIIAAEKNRSGTAALGISIFFSPVLPYLYLLAVPARLSPEKKTDYVADLKAEITKR